MGIKNIALLLFALCATGCAQPKYENADSGQTGQNSANDTAADCTVQFNASKNCLTWKWQVFPTSPAMGGTLVFKIYRLNRIDNTPVPLDVAALPALVLLMPEMGHGSSPTTVTRGDVGTFVVNDIYFVMPGKWQMNFQIPNGAQAPDEAIVPITIK